MSRRSENNPYIIIQMKKGFVDRTKGPSFRLFANIQATNHKRPKHL